MQALRIVLDGGGAGNVAVANHKTSVVTNPRPSGEWLVVGALAAQ